MVALINNLLTYLLTNVKGEIERKFSVPTQKCQIMAVFGARWSGVRKSFDFYYKRLICAWIHVVEAILHENRLGGVASRSVGEK